MAKTTVAQLEKRVGSVEGACHDLEGELAEVREETKAGFADLKSWMGNGFTKQAAKVFVAMFEDRERQRRDREKDERIKELEEQGKQNREYGAERDRIQKEERDAAERRTKILVAIIAAVGVLMSAGASIAVALIARGG